MPSQRSQNIISGTLYLRPKNAGIPLFQPQENLQHVDYKGYTTDREILEYYSQFNFFEKSTKNMK